MPLILIMSVSLSYHLPLFLPPFPPPSLSPPLPLSTSLSLSLPLSPCRFDVSNRGALSELDFLDGWAMMFQEPGGDAYLANFQALAATGFKKA